MPMSSETWKVQRDPTLASRFQTFPSIRPWLDLNTECPRTSYGKHRLSPVHGTLPKGFESVRLKRLNAPCATSQHHEWSSCWDLGISQHAVIWHQHRLQGWSSIPCHGPIHDFETLPWPQGTRHLCYFCAVPLVDRPENFCRLRLHSFGGVCRLHG